MIAFTGTKLAFIEPVGAPSVLSGVCYRRLNPSLCVNKTLIMGFGFFSSSRAVKVIFATAICVSLNMPWLYAGTVLHRLDLAHKNATFLQHTYGNCDVGSGCGSNVTSFQDWSIRLTR